MFGEMRTKKDKLELDIAILHHSFLEGSVCYRKKASGLHKTGYAVLTYWQYHIITFPADIHNADCTA